MSQSTLESPRGEQSRSLNPPEREVTSSSLAGEHAALAPILSRAEGAGQRWKRFTTADRRFGVPEWIALGLYAVLVAWLTVHHEPWPDEAQAWLIARDNSFFGMLRQVHYEGNTGAVACRAVDRNPPAPDVCRHALGQQRMRAGVGFPFAAVQPVSCDGASCCCRLAHFCCFTRRSSPGATDFRFC